MSETHSGSAADPVGPLRHGARRRLAARTWGWVVAGIVVVALLATAGRLVLRSDAEAALGRAAAQPASPSPSASPTPTEPSPADYSLTTLTRPVIDQILPGALPLAKLDTIRDLPGVVAAPRSPRIPAYARPDVTEAPVLALESEYYEAEARWLVLERRSGWVRVLVPYGRGALPSDDPDRVNGISAWLRTDHVHVEQEKRTVVIDLSDRTVTVTHADGTSDRLAAAVGAPATPTPLGLTQVFTVTEAVNTGLSVFLSMQSEALDGFYGTDYAATAIHVGTGQGQAVSNGCVRLTSADLDLLTDLAPGVPVLITP